MIPECRFLTQCISVRSSGSPFGQTTAQGRGRRGSWLLKMFFRGQILRGAELDTSGDAIPAHLRFAVAAGPAKG